MGFGVSFGVWGAFSSVADQYVLNQRSPGTKEAENQDRRWKFCSLLWFVSGLQEMCKITVSYSHKNLPWGPTGLRASFIFRALFKGRFDGPGNVLPDFLRARH